MLYHALLISSKIKAKRAQIFLFFYAEKIANYILILFRLFKFFLLFCEFTKTYTILRLRKIGPLLILLKQNCDIRDPCNL